jgi:hypothetical protein
MGLMLTLQLILMDHDYCIWLYGSHRPRVYVETHKRLCRFKKTRDREFSNVSKVHYAL